DPFVTWTDDNASVGLGGCRSLITSHGGEIRLVQEAAPDPTFQIELPCVTREKSSAAPPDHGQEISRPMIALVIEPSEPVQTKLRGLLTARGYRVVPVNSSDEGLDLALRLKFDAIFCSVHAPGLNWIETAEHVMQRVGIFVLLSDAYDADLAADFAGERRFVLA